MIKRSCDDCGKIFTRSRVVSKVKACPNNYFCDSCNVINGYSKNVDESNNSSSKESCSKNSKIRRMLMRVRQKQLFEKNYYENILR